MANKKKYSKYCLGNIWLMLFAAANILSLFLMYIMGGEKVIPIEFLNGTAAKITSVFGIMFALLKVLPALLVFITQIFPADAVKKYVVTFFASLWLIGGEVILAVVLLQSFEGRVDIGFILGILSGILILAGTLLFTKINKAPAKHKTMIWYRGFNKIILLTIMPLCTAFTVGIIMFASLVFRFPFITILGIMCLWGSFVLLSVVAVMTTLGKCKAGMLYYAAAFLSTVAIVSLCWSANVFVMLFGCVAAAASGVICLMLGGVARKYF